MRKMRSSFSISSTMASLSASRKPTVRGIGPLLLVRELGKAFEGQFGALVGELHRLLDLLCDLLLDGDDVLLVHLRPHEQVASVRDRIALLPLLDLFLRPVEAGVGHGVTAKAVGDDLDQRRDRFVAGPADCLANALAHADDVVAVEAIARNAVAE